LALHHHSMLALLGSLLGFGRLEGRLESGQNLTSTFDECRLRLGNTLGEPWMRCVVDSLLEVQATAKARGEEYFPIEAHTFDPLAPLHGHSYGTRSDDLKNKMRDYSCDVADGGSQPLRTTAWQYEEPDVCASAATEGGAFVYKADRFLPAGNDLDLGDSHMSVHEAQERCEADVRCQGFTFSAAGWSHSASRMEERQWISFKSKSEDATRGDGWHTFKRRGEGIDCSARALRQPRILNFTVHVLRETPPVYLVDDFYSEAECSYMLNYTLPLMGPSVVVGGGTSTWRQSYSVNMYPDYDDETNVVTQAARRKFAFARTMGGYTDLQENEGQEPVNAVYYKDFGDHYGAHCDGECSGGRYLEGHRIATSVTYCQVAEEGGYTLFTRSGLKVVPKPRQMLFFGYIEDLASMAMDRGHTEHSGCPLRKGRKWITTMWYRQGVTKEKDWSRFTV